MSMACGQGSTIKGIPDNVRDYIQLVGNRADVKFDTLSRKKIPQELYDNEGVLISFMLHSYFSQNSRPFSKPSTCRTMSSRKFPLALGKSPNLKN